MEPLLAGTLVKLATGGPELDGIVFDTPSDQKAVVAVVDAKRGPMLRTVETKDLTEREEPGPQDGALHALIRRTPHTARGGKGGAASSVQGRPGHTRATGHRTTGK
jgi:hypothetical protein